MERWQQRLDRYITGGRYRQWLEELVCEKCGRGWEAEMYEEYGMVGYIDDDESVCPECQEEHK